MDTRDTEEQAELRRSTRRLARDLGPHQVTDLEDGTRRKRLDAALREAGLLELRDASGDGTPLASGVEAAIVADALGASVADVPFIGPLLAADLARRAGVSADDAVVAHAPDLIGPGVVDGPVTTTAFPAIDVDPESTERAYVIVADGSDHRLAQIALDGQATGGGTDLTRALCTVSAGAAVTEVAGVTRLLTADELAAWTALGLALTSADLVGVMRGVLDVTVAYAADRRQYGVAVGSFQAVQHLVAEAHCLMEGAHSTALHASWAVDALEPAAALLAGRVAKAYCARAARTVCETAVQVHGGIGNTWECIVHVYLRRALLSAQWFGDDRVQLGEIERARLVAV